MSLIVRDLQIFTCGLCLSYSYTHSFVDSKRSRARLLVTRELFDRLIEICEVFHIFREFVVSFGPVKNDEPHEYRSPQHVHRKISHTITTGSAETATVATYEKLGFGKMSSSLL